MFDNAKMSATLIPVSIEGRIKVIRGLSVILDTDLAALYGVRTGVLIQSVKRNLIRFPADFMFQLDKAEWKNLKTQIEFSSSGHGGRRYAPFAFTEHGVAMLSSVLHSTNAIVINVEIMRTFVRVREVAIANKDLVHRLDELESKTEKMSMQHEHFEHDTRDQILQILDAMRQLMAPPEAPRKRPIGFVSTDKD